MAPAMSKVRDEAGRGAEGSQIDERTLGGEHIMIVGKHVPQAAAQKVSALLGRFRRINRHLSAESVEHDLQFLFRRRRLPPQLPEMVTKPQRFFIHLLHRRVIYEHQWRPLPPHGCQFLHQRRIIKPVREKTLERLPALLFCQTLFHGCLGLQAYDTQNHWPRTSTPGNNITRESFLDLWKGEGDWKLGLHFHMRGSKWNASGLLRRNRLKSGWAGLKR